MLHQARQSLQGLKQARHTSKFDPPAVVWKEDMIYIYSYGQICEMRRVACARTELHG